MKTSPSAFCLAPVLAVVSDFAGAHGGAHTPADFHFWSEWSARPGVLWPLLIGFGLYLTGIARLWGRAGVGRGISRVRAASFCAGLLVLTAALISPLDAISASLFWLHMVQHLLLILVAAPLLVLGAPEVAWLWALPARWRGAVGRVESRIARSIIGRDHGSGKGPLIVVVMATGVLWAWHAPVLYDLAFKSDALHTAEHVGFLITSILFWATILRFRTRERLGNGLRMLNVFAMAMQGSILGALITFARVPLYESHLQAPTAWGLEPLEDQQIAGLIMWVPPAFLYIGVLACLFVGWLDAVASRRQAEEARSNLRARARDVSSTPHVVSKVAPRTPPPAIR